MARLFSDRVIAELVDSANLDPSAQLDSQEWPALPALSGFRTDSLATLLIAPADADVEHEIGNVVALLVLSDEPITIKLASGETPMNKACMLYLRGKDLEATVISGPLLISGNGANEATVKIWAIVRP